MLFVYALQGDLISLHNGGVSAMATRECEAFKRLTTLMKDARARVFWRTLKIILRLYSTAGSWKFFMSGSTSIG